MSSYLSNQHADHLGEHLEVFKEGVFGSPQHNYTCGLCVCVSVRVCLQRAQWRQTVEGVLLQFLDLIMVQFTKTHKHTHTHTHVLIFPLRHIYLFYSADSFVSWTFDRPHTHVLIIPIIHSRLCSCVSRRRCWSETYIFWTRSQPEKLGRVWMWLKERSLWRESQKSRWAWRHHRCMSTGGQSSRSRYFCESQNTQIFDYK